MATITPVLKTWRSDKKGRHLVLLRLEAANKKRYISLGFSILPSQWNGRSKRIRAGHPQAEKLNAVIEQKLNAANDHIADCLLKDAPVTADSIKAALSSRPVGKDFWVFAENWLEEKRRKKQIRYWKRSRAVLAKFRDSAGSPLPWHALTLRSLKDFDLHMTELGNNGNTRGIAFKVLKTILGDAEHEGILSPLENPFVRFRMPEGNPVKRDWLSREELGRLAAIVLEPGSIEAIARDMYLFAFWTRGTRFGDLVTLESSSVTGGRVSITMSKTGQSISMPVSADMEVIIDRYAGGKLVFPLLEGRILTDPEAIVSLIGSANARVNKALKSVVEAAGISKKVTFHTARHSFAHMAYSSGVDVKDVQRALAHSKASTTDAYLKSLDDSSLDAEMAKVFKSSPDNIVN